MVRTNQLESEIYLDLVYLHPLREFDAGCLLAECK